MKRSRLAVTAMTCGLLLLTALYGCDGSGDNSGGGELRVAAQEVLNSFDTINTVNAAFAAQGGALAERGGGTFNSTVNCSTGGQALGSGVASRTASPQQGVQGFSVDLTAQFVNCNGLSGTITIEIDGTVNTASSTAEIDIVVDGRVANACVIAFDRFSASLDINLGTNAVTGTVNGSATGSCGTATARCTWRNVDLLNEAALEAGCQ